MQLAQATELEGNAVLPWFLLKTGSVTASAATATAPTGFLREYEEGGLWGTDDDGLPYKIDKDDFAVLNAEEWEAGAPQQYALVGGTLYFFPTPDVSRTLTMYGYFADTPLGSSDIENNWLLYAPDLMIAQAGVQIARYLRDPDMVQLFSADVARAWGRIQRTNVANAQAAFAQFIGG